MLDGQKSENRKNGKDTYELQPRNEKTLASGKERYDQPRQRIKKQRHYFANKFCLGKAMAFPVVICESWTIKKAEC